MGVRPFMRSGARNGLSTYGLGSHRCRWPLQAMQSKPYEAIRPTRETIGTTRVHLGKYAHHSEPLGDIAA
jgi:hypothetical protein